MRTNPAVVRNVNHIVELGPVSNDGCAQSCAVDASIRANLNVGANFNRPDLRHFAIAARLHLKTETVRADHRARMDYAARTDPDAI